MGEKLSLVEQELFHRCAELVGTCHWLQTRSSPHITHYSIHLLAVEKRFRENFVEVDESFAAKSGQPLHALVIGQIASLLHDAGEDINVTYKAIPNRAAGIALVQNLIKETFLHLLDRPTLDRLVGLIKRLSIHNDQDFPDTAYAEAIYADQIARQIKCADVDDNMSSMPSFGPTSGSFVFPALYSEAMAESPYAENFLRQVALCVHNLKSWPFDPSVEPKNGAERTFRKLLNFEGELALYRLDTFYKKLDVSLLGGRVRELLPEGMPVGRICGKVREVSEWFSRLTDPKILRLSFRSVKRLIKTRTSPYWDQY